VKQFAAMRLHQLLEQNTWNNATGATVQLLKKLNVPVTNTSVIESLEQHPDYPSLYSISDSLKKWKVESLALKVEADKLEEVPTPFIAHIKNSGGSFVLVDDVNGSVSYVNENGKKSKKTKEEFLQEWSNIALVAERSTGAGEINFAQKKRKEVVNNLRIPFLIFASLVLVVFYSYMQWQTPASFLPSFLLLIKLAGIVISGLLLWFEIDKANPVLKQFCSAGKNTNCSSIVNSKASKLFNFISWSEIGFFYFAGGFIFLLLSVNSQLSAFTFLSWLNLFALPYTLFSVFYQWRIAKQWCRLCLFVQGILLAEFVVGYFGYGNTFELFNLSTFQLLPLLTSFLLPVFFWIAAKKTYLSAQQAKSYQKEAAKLKYNKEIFNALLTQQKQVTASTEGLGITLGNPSAKHTIIKVCNPYCGPCAKAHAVIDELLETEDVRVQIIFTAKNEEADTKAKPVKHLMVIAEREDQAIIKKALDDWYGAAKKDYESFAAAWPLNGELVKQGGKLEAMDKWCEETGISFTPTIFIDGYQMPQMYSAENLKHLL